jgi:hypothetical protein
MTEKQIPLLTKVIDIKSAKQNKKGQQGLFEQEERYIAFSTVEEGLSNIQRAFSERQVQLTDKVDRLTNTLENIIPKFEMGISGTKPDIYIDSLAPGKKADLATIDASLPSEACYPFITSELAQLIGMNATRLGTLLRRAGITGNDSYHHPFKTGASGFCQRYKMTALYELYKRALAGSFEGMKAEEIANLENYLKIREAEQCEKP